MCQSEEEFYKHHLKILETGKPVFDYTHCFVCSIIAISFFYLCTRESCYKQCISYTHVSLYLSLSVFISIFIVCILFATLQ